MVGKRDKECSERAYNEETDKTQGFPRAWIGKYQKKRGGRPSVSLPVTKQVRDWARIDTATAFPRLSGSNRRCWTLF